MGGNEGGPPALAGTREYQQSVARGGYGSTIRPTRQPLRMHPSDGRSTEP